LAVKKISNSFYSFVLFLLKNIAIAIENISKSIQESHNVGIVKNLKYPYRKITHIPQSKKEIGNIVKLAYLFT